MRKEQLIETLRDIQNSAEILCDNSNIKTFYKDLQKTVISELEDLADKIEENGIEVESVEEKDESEIETEHSNRDE